jgi:phenylalanyl-tRNA synthetase alpha chain
MSDGSGELKDKVRALRAEFDREIKAVRDSSALQMLRDRYVGRKAGAVTALMKTLGALTAEARRQAGQDLNRLKDEVEQALETAKASLESNLKEGRLARERVDITLPGRIPPYGRRHPLTAAREDLEDIFLAMGYEIFDGPEVEDDYHCFEALNMPPDHPARDMQDTFWLPNNHLLRSHTTTVQARVLEQHPPLPIKVVAAGRVYRNEAVDATHLAMFHQFEGIWVEEGLTYGDLKGTLLEIAKSIYGEGHEFRFKPKYYPYTEPSVGMDMQCTVCLSKDENCPACRGAGWITILGSGMIHPKVFLEFGYDHTKLSGIAFGIGTTRIAAQAAGMTALKPLYEQDLRVHRGIHRGGM